VEEHVVEEHVVEEYVGDAHVTAESTTVLLPTPRAGQLSIGWRFAMIALWVGVVLAWSAVWNVSVQLGLSTWWLGPRADQTPAVVRLLPFVAPAIMLLAIINNVRWVAYGGLVAGVALAAIAIGDLGRVRNIGLVELTIAVVAGVASMASLAGTYRTATPDGSISG
jgi:hypothetical protein